MTENIWDQFGHEHELGDDLIPQPVIDVADGARLEVVWRNQLGGLTFVRVIVS
jgi:hypothetical protein